MEEKMFELMEKMYIELQNLKQGQEKMGTDIKKLGLKIDGELIPKIDSLFDGYKQSTEKLEVIDLL